MADITVACSKCSKRFPAPPTMSGEMVYCPDCKQPVEIKAAPPEAPKPVSSPVPALTPLLASPNQQSPQVATASRKTSGKAIAGMVLGIMSIVPPCVFFFGMVLAILGLVFSILAMREINRKPLELEGTGIAIAGVVTSVLGFFAGLTILLIFGALGGMFMEFFKHIPAMQQGMQKP